MSASPVDPALAGAAAPQRLLVVDDEASHMKALCDTLRDQGHAVEGFTSPAAALAAVEPGRFAVLLTDLMMPEMDGIALLRAALARDPELAAVIMTGAGTIATAVEAMQVGALDYVVKPFKVSTILTVLSRALALRELRVRNAALERALRERAAELEAANRELEAFSYSISHDLRAPLRSIHGFSKILLDDFAPHLPDDGRRLVERVATNARRMGELIEDLLRFSRLSRQPLNRRPVPLAALVREVLEELRAQDPGRAVEVVVGELPDCIADHSLLRQIVSNLLANAFKYTRQRDAARVEVGCDASSGERVYFVRDNGAGFDMQHAHKLFGVFSRLHSADQFEGTGIGLSIVQRIVQRHGGRVWAEAEVDKGATFRFTLPD
jgi:two-component system, sensor histidine kinase and response regulator